jgi:putative transcriptional regulator
MRKTESPILAAVRDTAQGLHKAGVMDQVTLREFDPLCLRLLNSSLSTVQKWEIGQKKPTGTALKLLHLVQKRGIEIVA